MFELFGLFYDVTAGLFIQSYSYALLVFGITGGDVHGTHLLNEILLFIAQFVYQFATFQQSPMVMQVGRVIVACATPVSLDDFFQSLMALKSYIEPSATLLHPFCCINVSIHNIKPFLHSAFVCHIIFYSFQVQKYETFLKKGLFFGKSHLLLLQRQHLNKAKIRKHVVPYRLQSSTGMSSQRCHVGKAGLRKHVIPTLDCARAGIYAF